MTRNICRAIMFLLFFTQMILAQESVSPKWDFFQSVEGKFRVKVPGEMTHKIDSIDTQVGNVAYHTFFHQATNPKDGNVLFMVSYCDYPPNAMHSDSSELIQSFFESTIDAATFSIAGDLAYTDDIELNGYPGKFWRVDYLSGQAVIKTKAYIVGSRYYSAQVVTIRKLSLNPDINKFLDSFGLL